MGCYFYITISLCEEEQTNDLVQHHAKSCELKSFELGVQLGANEVQW